MLFVLLCSLAAPRAVVAQALQTPADTQVVALKPAPQCLTEDLSSQNQIAEIGLGSDRGWPTPRSIAWSLSLDTIVVLHQRNREVALVSVAGGELLRQEFESFGRRPPTLIGTAGDSLLVWNENDQKVTILNRDFGRRGSITVTGLPETHRKRVIGQFPDGDLLVRMTMESAPDLDGYHARQRDVFLRHEASTGRLDTLIAVNGQRLADMQGITVPAPLSFQTTAVVSGNDLFVFEPSRGVLHQISIGGYSVYRIVSDETPDLSDDAKRSMLSLVFGPQAMSDSTLAAEALRLPFPDRPPAFEFLVGDSGGRLWLRRLRSPDISSEWIVLGTRGGLTSPCRVVGPPGLEVIDVADSTFLALWTDGVTGSSAKSYRIAWRER